MRQETPLKYVGTDRTKRDVGHGPELFCPLNIFTLGVSNGSSSSCESFTQTTAAKKPNWPTTLQVQITEHDDLVDVTELRLTICMTTLTTKSPPDHARIVHEPWPIAQ